MRGSKWMALATTLALVSGCGDDETEPTLGSLSPAAICTDGQSIRVTVTGTGFAPVVRDGLSGEASLAPPSVKLSRTMTLVGAGVPGAVDWSLDPSRVHWTGQEQISLDFSAIVATPGLYNVEVRNGNGESSLMKDALLIVPAPVSRSATPFAVTQEDGGLIAIDGDFFILSPSSKPKISLVAEGKAPVVVEDPTLESCLPLPGKSGLSTCKRLTFVLPPTGLTIGNYALEIENPAPVGCSSATQVARAGGAFPITVVPRPKLTSVLKDMVCTAEVEATLAIAGSDFLTSGVDAPILRFGEAAIPTIAGVGCAEIPLEANFLPRVAPLMRCSTLSAVIPVAGVAPGLYTAVVENPGGSGKTIDAVPLVAAGAPSVSALEGNFVCAGGGEGDLKIMGSGFLTIAESMPTVMVAGVAVPLTASKCAPIRGFRAGVELCTELEIDLPETTTAGSIPIVVTNPAEVGCVSKEPMSVINIPPVKVTGIDPPRICGAADSEVTIEGENFLFTGSVTSLVTLSGIDRGLTVTPKKCLPILAPTVPPSPLAGQLCKELEISIPSDAFDVRETGYSLEVTNPPPADCAETATAPLLVVMPPTISSATVSSLIAGASIISIQGANFAPGAKVTVNGLATSGGTVLGPTSAVAVVSADPTGGGTTGVIVIDNGDGCGASASVQIPSPGFPFGDTAPAVPLAVFSDVTTPLALTLPEGMAEATAVELHAGSVRAATLPFARGTGDTLVALVPKGTRAEDYDVIVVGEGRASRVASLRALASEDALTVTAVSDSSAVEVEISAGEAGLPAEISGWFVRSDDTASVANFAAPLVNDGKRARFGPASALAPARYDLVLISEDRQVGVAPRTLDLERGAR